MLHCEVWLLHDREDGGWGGLYGYGASSFAFDTLVFVWLKNCIFCVEYPCFRRWRFEFQQEHYYLQRELIIGEM